jgi:hypothetical protein
MIMIMMILLQIFFWILFLKMLIRLLLIYPYNRLPLTRYYQRLKLFLKLIVQFRQTIILPDSILTLFYLSLKLLASIIQFYRQLVNSGLIILKFLNQFIFNLLQFMNIIYFLSLRTTLIILQF